jgi:short subunit dehydrogenase
MKDSEVVVVTGAGAGLGRAIVQSFAKRGAQIGLIARGRERLEDAADEAHEPRTYLGFVYKSRMPRKAQPVPPIFQPEVCAEAAATRLAGYGVRLLTHEDYVFQTVQTNAQYDALPAYR